MKPSWIKLKIVLVLDQKNQMNHWRHVDEFRLSLINLHTTFDGGLDVLNEERKNWLLSR